MMDLAITRLRLSLSAAVVMLLFGSLTAHAQSAPADSSRSADGAFTAAQAAEGEGVFRNTCGNCHSTSQFHGPTFRKYWAGLRVYDLFDQLRNTMPIDNPGGLTTEAYAAVVAYILKLNDYSAGTTPLPTSDAALKSIRF